MGVSSQAGSGLVSAHFAQAWLGLSWLGGEPKWVGEWGWAPGAWLSNRQYNRQSNRQSNRQYNRKYNRQYIYIYMIPAPGPHTKFVGKPVAE